MSIKKIGLPVLGMLLCIFCLTVNGQMPLQKLQQWHQKYKGNWPKTMTYIKEYHRTQYNQNETFTRYYAAIYPDKFREDMSIDNGDAEITIKDKMYVFKAYRNKMTFSKRNNIEYYFLTDIYADSFEAVKERLVKEEIDITKSYVTTWKGKKVYIIGASTSDTTISQVWFDALEMYPIRLIMKYKNDLNIHNYHFFMRKIEGIWFPEETQHYINKRLVLQSKYRDVTINNDLDPAVFDIDNFGSVHWYSPS